LVFSDEMRVWLGETVHPSYDAVTAAPPSLDRLIQDARARRPQDNVKFLIRDDDEPMWVVAMGPSAGAQENTALFMFDARTGAFLHSQPVNEGVVNLLFKLHVELLAGLPGTLFLGGMGVLFVVSILSGIVVYGPFMRKLPFGTVRRGKGSRLLMSDLHNFFGITTMLWVVVVGITGVVNTLDRPLLGYWQATEIAGMLKGGKDSPPASVIRPVDDIVQASQQTAADKEIRFVAFPGTPFAGPHHYMVFMRGTTPLTSKLLEPLLIDAESGKVSASGRLPWYLTALLVSQPLHFGDYGGLPMKILWAALDVVTILILVSGVYLWWKKRRRSLEEILNEADRSDEAAFVSAGATNL
jgi:uncharacterized iron-regulated membrane protein